MRNKRAMLLAVVLLLIGNSFVIALAAPLERVDTRITDFTVTKRDGTIPTGASIPQIR